MSKKLNCSGCNKYLGIIHEASLAHGIVFLCKSCEQKRIASDLMRKNKKYDLPEGFENIFGGFK